MLKVLNQRQWEYGARANILASHWDAVVARGEVPGVSDALSDNPANKVSRLRRALKNDILDDYAPGSADATPKVRSTVADLLNDRVVPLFDAQGIKLHRILTDRVAEYCGKPEHHAYQLYLAVEGIDHSRTKANHPQTNGACERFHKTLQDECYSLLFRRKLYRSLEELQTDLDAWLEHYNRERPHSGRYCYGKTPWETFQATRLLPAADRQ